MDDVTPTDPVRTAPTDEHRWSRVVIKIGSSALVSPAGGIDHVQLGRYAEQMSILHARGVDVVCVSSGAVAAGLADLGLTRRPSDLPGLQAAAAAGQARLVEQYRQQFSKHGIGVAQILLTHDDLRSRVRHVNARYTFDRLLRARLIPIVNENDSVAVDEIRVGDNDTLSALVATLLHADSLVLLTNTDGLLDALAGDGGTRIARIGAVTDDVRAHVRRERSALGTGGMMSKLDAADMMLAIGERAYIAEARMENVIVRLFNGEDVGTMFAPAGVETGGAARGDQGQSRRKMSGRKKWIAYFDHPQGVLHLDDGAVQAVVRDGRSLLAVGIRAIEGSFAGGAPVRLVDSRGQDVARGLTNFSSDDLQRIAGCASDRIAGILGRCEYDEVIHRDNLALRAT
jgi:glutamate 5-kinase